jgi:hypothetical protein
MANSVAAPATAAGMTSPVLLCQCFQEQPADGPASRGKFETGCTAGRVAVGPWNRRRLQSVIRTGDVTDVSRPWPPFVLSRNAQAANRSRVPQIPAYDASLDVQTVEQMARWEHEALTHCRSGRNPLLDGERGGNNWCDRSQ